MNKLFCATIFGIQNIKTWLGDFPGGPVVKNPPYNAGNAGSITGQGTKVPQAVGQLSPCATTTELARLNERARVPQTAEPTRSGTHAPQLERSPSRPCAVMKRSCMPQQGSRVPQLRPNAAKKKKNKENK